jgi:dihydroorotate dehydrogenase (fumarate)
MNLKTSYLGLELDGPLMPGACPLSENLDTIRKLEDAGASAIVMYSLFEEQILREEFALQQSVESTSELFAEATTFFPNIPSLRIGPDEYLDNIRKTKEAVSVPVIASLNGYTPGGWTDYAGKIQQAGADALELNIYFVGRDFAEPGDSVERRTVQIVEEVRNAVDIPVAVKIGPFFSSMANLARKLDKAGADGLVLFNRFFQPDLDIEKLEVIPNLELSTSYELRLRLRWLALLSGRVKASLAVTGGVHSGQDVIKAIMAGAHAVQVVSALLKLGPEYLKKLKADLTAWMAEHEYESVDKLRGCMSAESTDDLPAIVRSNYMQILKGWTQLGE